MVSFGSGNVVVAQTAAFATWMFTHVLLAYNMRSDTEPLFTLGVLTNRPMIIWALGAIGLLIFAVSTPILHQAFKLTYLTIGQWVLAVGVAFVLTFWIEERKLIFHNSKNNKRSSEL